MRQHPTADDVYTKVSEICPGISKGTVYRDLNRLADKGDILRVAVANAPDRFDFTTEHHAHCLCSVCGKISDYVLKVNPEPDDKNNNDFQSQNIDIIINGICKDCRRVQNG